jgi:hypothetical protein
MPVQVMFLCYILLMLSLAQIVRLEGIRRRRGPSLKRRVSTTLRHSEVDFSEYSRLSFVVC